MKAAWRGISSTSSATYLPLFREAQKERGHEIPDAGELVSELERWNGESYDQHVVQKVGPLRWSCSRARKRRP